MTISRSTLLTLYFTTLLMLFVFSAQVNASVTMTGTRIIYNEGAKSVDVHLKNKDKFPYVVQTWFDDGNINDGPDKASSIPFVSTPAVIRIQPQAGQVIKINFTGKTSLPQDRESVFYFNFLQIPPSKTGEGTADTNKMLVMLRNRVKLFYRPAGLVINPRRILSELKVDAAGSGKQPAVVITNSQPFFVSLSNVQLANSAGKWSAKTDMIPPFSSRTFLFPGARIIANSTVTVVMINDQGARLSESFKL